MADVLHEGDVPPPVPGFWRLGWLLFMQPLTLRRLLAAWGLKDNGSLWALRGKLRRDPVVRALVVRLGGWPLMLMPVSLGVVVDLQFLGLPINWFGITVGLAVGIFAYVTVSIWIGIAEGSAIGFSGGVVGGVILGCLVPAGDITKRDYCRAKPRQ